MLLSVHVPGDAPSGRSPFAYMAFVLACLIASWSTKVFFFPTCQVRIVRFYKSCPLLLLLLLLLLLVLLFASSSPSSSPALCCRAQWASPDLSRELEREWAAQDLNGGAREWSGHRRTSTGKLPSGVGSAGPRPGSLRAGRAVPQPPEIMPEDMSERMSLAGHFEYFLFFCVCQGSSCDSRLPCFPLWFLLPYHRLG